MSLKYDFQWLDAKNNWQKLHHRNLDPNIHVYNIQIAVKKLIELHNDYNRKYVVRLSLNSTEVFKLNKF